VDEDPARAAVVAAVAAQLEPGMLLGLGSGRAVWALIDARKTRWAGRLPRVVVAERAKLVGRLGEGMALPVEAVRFAWAQTRRRLLEVVPEATLRLGDDRTPIVTGENHYLLDCVMPEGRNLAELSRALKATLGVVEHGLFLGMADQAFLGSAEGRVETLFRRVGAARRAE
jgi:ribose 5-phosphate isomerase